MLLPILVVAALFGVSTASHRHYRPDANFVNGKQVYWWTFADQDCSFDDVPGANCINKSMDDCKVICLNTPTCAGFNSNGYLKFSDCLDKKSLSGGTTIYFMEDKPQPPPPPPAYTVAWPPIVPHPSKFSNGTKTVVVDPKLVIKATKASSDDLVAAFDRFSESTFYRRVSNPDFVDEEIEKSARIVKMEVVVDDAEVEIQLEMDESYTLEIATSAVFREQTITLAAKTQVGAMRGLETLSQLIRFDASTESYYIAGAPWIIEDTPRFKHRELLIDSSRHYQTVPMIKSIIDSMTYAKINVLHWHLVDHQSFPFRAPSVPLLADKGAYSPYERYTVGDVEDVIEYARQRGIRVVVEIDNPGHAVSWCAGYPEICPSLTCQQPLNPITNRTFEVIEDLFRDLTGGARGKGPFFDNFMHLGGDEVDTSCWDSTPEIAAWMKAKNFTATDTFFYFVGRSQEIAHKMGRDVVGWEEIWNGFGTKLAKETIIQVWLNAGTTKDIVEHGYRAIFSPYPIWYLDYLNQNWKDNYLLEPCYDIADDLCAKYVLGGGGEMWGETVDGSDVMQTVWPRLGAIAERLWSPRHINDTDHAEPRMHNFRCTLIERGVAAAPLTNPTARTAPLSPGGCYAQ